MRRDAAEMTDARSAAMCRCIGGPSSNLPRALSGLFCAAGVPQPLRQAVEGVRKVRGAYREGGRGQLRLLVQQPSATSTGGSCAFPELLYAPPSRYSDYVHCVDTCGAKVLFATLR